VFGTLRVGENGSPTVYDLKNGGHGASYEVTANEVRVLKGKEGAVLPGEDSPADTNEDVPF
jgi:hypothetical protein